MGNGRYCDVHGEWAPDGQCRWCEPVQADYIEPKAGPLSPLAARVEMTRAELLEKFPLEDVPVTPPADCYAGIDRASAPFNQDATCIDLSVAVDGEFFGTGRVIVSNLEKLQNRSLQGLTELIRARIDAVERTLSEQLARKFYAASEAKPFAPACDHPQAFRMRNEMMRTESCGSCGMVLAADAKPARLCAHPYSVGTRGVTCGVCGEQMP